MIAPKTVFHLFKDGVGQGIFLDHEAALRQCPGMCDGVFEVNGLTITKLVYRPPQQPQENWVIEEITWAQAREIIASWPKS